jgi:hypothetical protein
MSAAWQTLVPEHLHDAVTHGLRAAFGTTEARSVEPVTGGASGATTLRLQVDQRASLLRVETARTPWRNPHQYTCMRIAAGAAVAPPLYYVDDAAGVAIMEFIATKPLTVYPGGPVELVRALGRLTATLQATEPFPALMDYRTVVSKLTERLQTRFAPGLLDPHREALERLCATLPWDPSNHVSSHNDPNPRNVLFDGQRLWLVDWETAYRNDPLVDMAILGDNLAQTPDLEEALLQAWLGHEPQPPHRQRLKALRSLTRLYYAGMLAILIAPTTPVISDLVVPSREEFAQGIAKGSLKFTAPETRVTLVKMCLAGFLESLQ